MIVKGKKYWGVIPLAVYLILQILVMVTEQVTDSQLRSIPQIILFWMGIFSGLIFLFWAAALPLRFHFWFIFSIVHLTRALLLPKCRSAIIRT